MTPRLRTQRQGGHGPYAAGLGLLLVLLAGGTTHTSYAYAAPAAREAPPSPSVSSSRTPAAGPSRSPAPDTSRTPRADASRAGSEAGEGRRRPGREEPAPREEDAGATHAGRDPDGRKRPDRPVRPAGRTDADAGDGTSEAYDTDGSGVADSDGVPESAVASEAPGDTGLPPPSPAPAGRSVTRSAPQEPVLQILPLGSGLILIGCGLGLAFLALRVRRG
ncbi:hypothetical protein [Streptomyces sp. NPDC005301]|uniref:hypothetical protein n=1 Tax=unclassified Streptomyces TaxID=2593676 RepID=UPI00339E6BA3